MERSPNNNSEENDKLPEGWATTELSQVVVSQKGKKPKSLIAEPRDGFFPYILIDQMEGKPAKQFTDDKSIPIASNSNVLIVWDGSIGKTASGIIGAVGSTIANLTPILIEPSYLEFFLRLCKPYIEQNSRGSSLQHINPDIFWAIGFPVAPLAEQKRIVARIEELLAQVKAVTKRLDKVPMIMKHFRQAVLTAACSGKLTEGWREENKDDESASEQLKVLNAERRRFPEAKHYRNHEARELTGIEELPENWVWTSVDSISIKVVDGVHKKPEYISSGIPFITVRNLTKGPGIDFERVNYISEIDHKQFIRRANPEQGDILVTKDGTLGVVRAIITSRIFSIFVSVALIKPVSKDLTDYLELALSSPIVQRLMVATGSGLQHIHLRDLRNTFLPFPQLSEQREIVRRVEALFKLAETIEKRIGAAKVSADKLTQSILAKAFRGKLVPTEADLACQEGRSYEPASVLLERIKTERERKPSSLHRGGIDEN